MKYVPKINWANWPTWSFNGCLVVGGFLAGGITATNPPAFLQIPPRQAAVTVKPVQTAMVVPDKRTAELCAIAADNVAKMREELKELRTKAAAKIAPSK